jgi:hypothetical protein
MFRRHRIKYRGCTIILHPEGNGFYRAQVIDHERGEHLHGRSVIPQPRRQAIRTAKAFIRDLKENPQVWYRRNA